MSSEMRKELEQLADECEGLEGLGSAVIGERIRAILARTEAGAVKCSDCDGDGETCLAGRSAHRSNWIKCAKCNGTGDAAPVADGAVAWTDARGLERLREGKQEMVSGKRLGSDTVALFAHPKDASGNAVTDAMVERAMNTSMPGGSTAWVWLFNCEGGMRPEDKHRDWFRRVLNAAMQAKEAK